MFGLFKITSAAMVPGTQPHIHKRKTINIDPQPLSNTDNGGNIIANNTLQILIMFFNLMIDDNYMTHKQVKCYTNYISYKIPYCKYFKMSSLVY